MISFKPLKEAISVAKKYGATVIEIYPIDKGREKVADVFAYTGFAHTFQAAGLKEVIRRSATRPIMRCSVG